MKIGMDIDGVILDYERVIRAKAELYDLLELHKNGVVNKAELKLDKRFNWTEAEIQNFRERYFLELNYATPLVADVKEVINYLNEDGHELIVISARCKFIPQMQDVAQEIFKKEDLVFAKYYWKVDEKLSICKNEKIDIMIDDYYDTCKILSESGIETLYFRDKDMKKLEESKYLKEVSNWGEIYRYIKNRNV